MKKINVNGLFGKFAGGLAVAAFMAASVAISLEASAEPVVIKLATSAPTGSLWFKELTKIGNVTEKATEGRVKIKIFGGSVLGDDKQVLDKMKYGQVQAAAMTGVGLGDLVPKTRLMELPFVFDNPKQIDCVLNKVLPEFNKELEKAGFINLGWAEQGLIYVFTSRDIKTLADMQKTKPWVWGSDPLARAIWEVFNVKPVPLALQDVYMSLQSGIIDTAYISPAAVTGLGWHQKAPNMLDVPVTNGAGALLLKKDVWDKISPQDQETLRKAADSIMGRLVDRSRQENVKAIQVLQEKGGVKLVQVPASERPGFLKKGEESADRLVGKLYTRQELDAFRAAVKACR